MSERICIAQIGGAHGIRGEVKLKSFKARGVSGASMIELDNMAESMSWHCKRLLV